MATKEFELNVKVLDNFENVMSLKLDEIEELKITGLDKNSKLLNIVSLCANIKKLVISGDQRLNVDIILSNVFKPDKLECLVLDNVKIPTKETLKRFKCLNEISLSNIRSGVLKEFFDGISVPKNIEKISISKTDMINISIDTLKMFENLRYLYLNNLKNCQFNNFKFLKENRRIAEIGIDNTSIPIGVIRHLLKCSGKKKISIDIEDIEEGKLQVTEEKTILTFPIYEFKTISRELNLAKITDLQIKVNKCVNFDEYMDELKYNEDKVHIMLKDFSCLDIETANKLKDNLKIENMEIAGQEYNIDGFIREREELQKVIRNVSNHVSTPEKFMAIYQYLGKEYVQKKDYEPRVLCEILENSLKCVNIKSNIISGQELENDKEHCWNQVELDGKWYNVDLVLDIPNIKKNRAEYCLLGDEDFIESHTPQAGKNSYCPETFNQKIVRVFLKTGLFKDKLFGSYLEIILDKIRELFKFNKKEEVLALPSGEEGEKEKINEE